MLYVRQMGSIAKSKQHLKKIETCPAENRDTERGENRKEKKKGKRRQLRKTLEERGEIFSLERERCERINVFRFFF